MDYTVHGVLKSQTRLRDFHFTSLHFRDTLGITVHRQKSQTEGSDIPELSIQVKNPPDAGDAGGAGSVPGSV